MLADPGSRVIGAFRMIDPDNTENNVPLYGRKNVAYPGYFVVDPSGVIVERFVDDRYDDRRTGSSIVATMFPELLEARGTPIVAPHLQIALGQTDSDVTLGSHVRLLVDLALPPNMHVYAPGVEGYRPVELAIDPSPWFAAALPSFPPSKTLRLEAIRETVPVFERQARITVDVVVADTFELMRTIARAPDRRQAVAVVGRLKYQACDDAVCYAPAEAALKWDIGIRLPDQVRITSGPPSDANAALVLSAVGDAHWRDIPSSAGVVRTFVAGGDDGRRPAVVFVHPDAGLSQWARAAAAALSTEGFRVFAPDLSSGSAVDLADVHSRLDAVLDAATAGSSAPVSVIGFSWGGTEARAFAARQPRLAKVIVFDDQPLSDDAWRQMLASLRSR
jgi:Thiol:disulfide interchange protein DsbD, N-terminal